ncbi:MAG: AbfB domain-containing protein [Bacillota bacterium]|jgi:hypothetical protein
MKLTCFPYRLIPRLKTVRLLGCFFLSLLVLSGLATGPRHRVAAASGYIFTAFTNSSESNMYVYQSSDALNFTLLQGPAYTPPSGLVRDPSIIRHTDGYYYIAYTTNWTGTNFGIARSSDLKSWTFVTNVDVKRSGVYNTWAPEWFIDSDGSVNLIVSLSTASYANFQPYKFTALNSGLTSWSSGVALQGLSPNYIDTFIVKKGPTYHAFTKNETTKYIEHATATSLTGPYTFTGTGDWAGWGSWIEGPALLRLANGTWRIFFDKYTAPTGYYYSDSNDLNTWSSKATLPKGLSGFVRHGTVLAEKDLPVASPAGSGVILQSYNYPTRYLHQLDYDVRIDAVATSDLNAQWRMVPGLADSNGYVSFESLAYPGYYLRHYDYDLRLDANNGADIFKADATFKQVAGLADSGYVSFQSYNYPNRYLRHYNYCLKLDPISSTLEKQDATFKIINLSK